MPEAPRISDQAASASPAAHIQVQTEAAPPSSEDYNCPICLDLLLEPVVGACGHEFCKKCYTGWLSRSRGYPNCPLCRKALAYTVPGISRRLAELIEAIFPEKTRLRRQMKDLERAAEIPNALPSGNSTSIELSAIPQGLSSHGYPHAIGTDGSPAAEPVGFNRDRQRLLQELRHIQSLHSIQNSSADASGSRSSYEPSPGLLSPVPSSRLRNGLDNSDPGPSLFDFSLHDSRPLSASYRPTSPTYYPHSPPCRPPQSPPYRPTSPAYGPLPTHSINAPLLSPTSPVWTPASPQYAPLSPGDRSALPADPPHAPAYSPISPGYIPASPSHRPASLEYDSTEDGLDYRYSLSYRGYRYPATSPPYPSISPPHDAPSSPAHSPGAAAARPGSPNWLSPAAQTELAARQAAGSASAALPHTLPAADRRLPAFEHFSRLLQSTDQLAQQLQGASERLPYLNEYAGRSFGRYAVHPTFHGQAQIAHPQAQQVIQQYDGHIAPAAAPWVAYGHYPAPSLSAYPPAPYSYGPYTAAGPAASSFAQSMPPSGTLPFTMGSEPRESARGTRRAQVAATAMIPARYRVRRAQRRE